jgi:hypothetical protein
MTHDELVAKAIEWLRRFEAKMPDRLRGVTTDRLPKRRVREAVVIDFTSDDDRGSIRVVMERDTGDLIEASHSPPKANKADDNGAQPGAAPNGGPATASGSPEAREGPPSVS